MEFSFRWHADDRIVYGCKIGSSEEYISGSLNGLYWDIKTDIHWAIVGDEKFNGSINLIYWLDADVIQF